MSRAPRKSDSSRPTLWTKACRFLASEDGPTAVEYAVMLGLIVFVCISAITTIGGETQHAFSKVANSL